MLLREWFSWFVSRVDVQSIECPCAAQLRIGSDVVLAVTVVLEIAARKNWRVRYGSLNFRIDVLYYVFYYGGIYHLIVFAWMYKLLAGFVVAYAPWLQMNLMAECRQRSRSVTMTVTVRLCRLLEPSSQAREQFFVVVPYHPPLADGF